MSRFPSMPLFIDAYLADTTHFSAEEHGAYLLLLMAMWRRNGRVPNDNRDLARMCCVSVKRWPQVKARLMPLLIEQDGELSQKKLTTTWAELKNKSAPKGSSDRHTKMNGNNDLSATRARASPEPYKKTFTDVNVSAHARAKKPAKNLMIEEIDRRLAALKEDDGDEGTFLLPAPRHN